MLQLLGCSRLPALELLENLITVENRLLNSISNLVLKNGPLLLLFELILRCYVMRHNVETLWLNRLGVLHLDNLIVAPHSMNDLILLHVDYLAHSVFAVVLPATLIRKPTHQVLLPAIPILHVILETSIIDLFSLLLQLAMAV